jgi:glutathione synthase/RimK-type ligase-like ATP-grasp enzyme
MDRGIYEYCLRESRSALLGFLFGGLPVTARWMSDPKAVWSAESKILQLSVANRLGFTIPTTVVTNDPAVVQKTYKAFGGQMIVKPIRSGYVEIGDDAFAIYTSQVLAEHLGKVETAQLSPAIYQPLIQKKSDIRLTVAGSKVFCAEIDSQSDPDAAVDWRKTSTPLLPHKRHHPPAGIASMAVELVKSLGLAFGALDFILTPSGDWIFLEINPNGQWLWLDEQLGFGISDEIARWLSI